MSLVWLMLDEGGQVFDVLEVDKIGSSEVPLRIPPVR